MHRRSLKLKVMAALFSAAFLLGTADVGASTYSGVVFIGTSKDDFENDTSAFVVNEGSYINCSSSDGSSFTPKLQDTVTITINDYWTGTIHYETKTYNTSTKKTSYEKIGTYATLNTLSDSSIETLNGYFADYDVKLTKNNDGNISISGIPTQSVAGTSLNGNTAIYPAIKKIATSTGYKYLELSGITYHPESTTTKVQDLGDADIYIMGESSFELNGDINTTANVYSIEDSLLKASGYILGGNITSSLDMSAGSDISLGIQATKIIATDSITAQNLIAMNGGSISALGLIKASADITTDFIKTEGIASTNVFIVGEINASSASITGDLGVNGSYSITGGVTFNGVTNLNNQKITGLAEGALSAASTDLVNGAQLSTIKVKSSVLTAGEAVSISSTGAISISKTGKVVEGNTGIITGSTIYGTTGVIQSSLNEIISSINKNQTSVDSLQDGMADLKKSVASINSTVANTTKNISSTLSSKLQANLGNLSDDGKSVIKNLIAETMRSMNVSTASVASSNEASPNTASSSPISIMPATVSAVEITNPVVASATSANVDGVYDMLNNKVGKTDFEALKTGAEGNITAIATNVEGIKANASAIDTLKTSKANVDGSNLNVGVYTEKLGTGGVEGDNAGLVTGGTVYNALDQKADKSYVEAGLGMMSKQLDSVKQTATRDINRMGANAAALTSLHPQDYNSADKLDFAAGYGHYHDSNATAVGAFYRPNASTMVSLAGTIGNGDSMVSAGLSFKLGMNANVEKVMISKDDFDKQQAVNHQMRGHLDDQTARLQQMEAALSAMISY